MKAFCVTAGKADVAIEECRRRNIGYLRLDTGWTNEN